MQTPSRKAPDLQVTLWSFNHCSTAQPWFYAFEHSPESEAAGDLPACGLSVFFLQLDASHLNKYSVSQHKHSQTGGEEAAEAERGHVRVKVPESRWSNTCNNKYDLAELEGLLLLILCCIIMWFSAVCVCVRGLDHSDADLTEQEVEALQAAWEAADMKPSHSLTVNVNDFWLITNKNNKVESAFPVSGRHLNRSTHFKTLRYKKKKKRKMWDSFLHRYLPEVGGNKRPSPFPLVPPLISCQIE